jgi:hypothetical protein
LTSFKPEDGSLPGKYQVSVVSWRGKPTLATKLSADYVPASFAPEFTVASDAAEPVAVDIDVPN